MTSRLDVSEASTLVLALLLRVHRSPVGTAVIDKVEAEAVRMLLGQSGSLRDEWLSALPDFSKSVLERRGGPEKFGPDDSQEDCSLEGAVEDARPWHAVGTGAYDGTAEELSFEAYNEEGSREANLCIDFGTALTKAFASRGWEEQYELPIGRIAGGEHPFMVESSIWIEGGRIYFGPEAVRRSEKSDGAQRRLDSMKSHILRLARSDKLDELVGEDFYPDSQEEQFTIAGLLTLYLAYIDQLVRATLEARGLPVFLRRRIARPCWSGTEGERASRVLKILVAKSIIVSDTLGDDLLEGLDINHAASVLDAVDCQLNEEELETVIANAIDADIAEPEAVAAPFDAANDWHYLTVVDVGAGTTDVATFLLRFFRDQTKVLLVPGSSRSMPEAGDRVDEVLFEDLLDQLRERLSEKRLARATSTLRHRIRDFKEAMFRDGELEIDIEDVSLYMELDDFLERGELAEFGRSVRDLVQGSLASIPELHARRAKEKGGVRILLTGGGSRLPMVEALKDGSYETHGYLIYARDCDASPGWLIHRSEEFRGIYSQLAVASGGASPDLPVREG